TAALLVFYGSAVAANGTWTGTISDSACGASHAAMTEHGKKATDKEGTEMCLKKGDKYVFVSGDKGIIINSQNFADFKKNAGDRGPVTGDVPADTITMPKVAGAKRRGRWSRRGWQAPPLEGLRGRDAAALAQIVTSHARSVSRAALALGFTDDAAQDLTQDVF